MKHLKTYENTNIKPKKSDYIVGNFYGFGYSKKDKLWENYLNNQIGKITKVITHKPTIEYNVDYLLTEDIINATFNKKELKMIDIKNNKKYIKVRVPIGDIIIFSENIENCITYLSMKKYNI